MSTELFFCVCVGTKGGKNNQNMPSLSETGGNKMPMSLNWVDPVGPVRLQIVRYNDTSIQLQWARRPHLFLQKHQKGSNKD